MSGSGAFDSLGEDDAHNDRVYDVVRFGEIPGPHRDSTTSLI